MPPTVPSPPRLIRSLVRLAERAPLERKLIVAPTFGAGRELLRRLALEGQGWVGFETTTPRPLAARIAREALEGAGLKTLDPFDQQALLDEALDGALAAGFDDAGLGELAEGVGFREAVHEAVSTLRLAGLSPPAVKDSAVRDRRKRRFLSRVLERYESLLHDRRRADTADVLRLAVEVLGGTDAEVPRLVGAEVVALVPGLGTRGLRGALLRRLVDHGAEVLDTDPVGGLETPATIFWAPARPAHDLSWLHAPEAVDGQMRSTPLRLFRAASITEELREVLRRVVDRGVAWDQVEIVATDAAAYGSALHALATRLEIPVTYAVGLPVERTRPGRVVQAYLGWIREGFQAAPIRRLLEAGDLRPPRSRPAAAPAELARRFRALRVGWGRRRYRKQLNDALASVAGLRRRRGEDEDTFQRRVQEARGELEGLRSILFPTLKATPSVPDRLGEGGEPVSPSELARGLKAFLRRVPRGTGPDAAALDEILRILERVEATLRRRTNFDAAVTILQRHLEIRVRAPEPGEPGPDDRGAPWRSEGGHLHLSDVEHGGFSGRRTVFVVGVDADRVPGGSTQDPVLLDVDRRALGADLPTSSDLLAERSFRFAAMLARLRGSVTLSYSAWSAADARTIAPSPVLLSAHRLAERNSDLNYEQLHKALGRLACSVPAPGRAPLDAEDVWLDALAGEGVLRDGIASVRASFPDLDDGLTAKEARGRAEAGSHHGVIPPRPELDPRENQDLVLSASRLEALGRCPLKYLYQGVWRVYPPDDPELDPDVWLGHLARGSLLHEVFESTLRLARSRGVRRYDPGLERLALEALETRVARARNEIPSPGEGVTRREIAGLEEDMRSFVRLVREQGAEWVSLELQFGLAGEEPVPMEVSGGVVRLRGAVDRIDEDLSGLHVIDYKTGVSRDFGAAAGVFNGGRRLQLAIYAVAAETLLGRDVVTGAYHYPTRRGQNDVQEFDHLRLAGAPALIGHLLDGVAAGHFVPTDDKGDCRFCDFADVCRVAVSEWGKVDSPLAEWCKQGMSVGLQPAFTHLKKAREFEQ